MFEQFLDDAAVFPPGSATVADAVTDHRRMRASDLARFVGPLLIGVNAVDELAHEMTESDHAFAVGLIGKPGDTGGLIDAYRRAGERGLRVTSAELALADRPIDALLAELSPLLDANVGLAVEVPDGGDISQVAAQRSLVDGGLLRAKLRTGGIAPGAVPSVDLLAGFLLAAVVHEVPMKLTAGLHHAVRTTEQHGVLNVAVGVHRALTGGDVHQALGEDDALVLAGQVTDLSSDQITNIRKVFTSFGCCGVREPLSEAAALGLLRPLV